MLNRLEVKGFKTMVPSVFIYFSWKTFIVPIIYSVDSAYGNRRLANIIGLDTFKLHTLEDLLFKIVNLMVDCCELFLKS